jgi:hypothetical protein
VFRPGRDLPDPYEFIGKPILATGQTRNGDIAVHENVHVNQYKNQAKREAMAAKGIDPAGDAHGYRVNRLLRDTLKQTPIIQGKVADRHYMGSKGASSGGSDLREMEAYYATEAAKYPDQGQIKTEMNQFDPEGDTYRRFLAHTEPGAYMIPRQPTWQERLQDQLDKGKAQFQEMFGE